jgi:putative hydrolase of the HAD superfamily
MDSLVELIRNSSRPLRPPPGPPILVGRLPRPPRAVLFDVYGTLLAHRTGRAQGPLSQRRMLGSLVEIHQLPMAQEDLAAAFTAAVAEERRLLQARGAQHPEIRVERIWGKIFPGRSEEEIRRLAVGFELAVNPAWPMPGLSRLLAFLRPRSLVLGIISNAQFYTPLLFRAFLDAGPEGLGFSPDLCLYSYEHGIAKPDRGFYKIAAKRLAARGIRRRETLMVGNDEENDLRPAAESGFMTVHLGPIPTRRGAGPDARVSRLSLLRELLAEPVSRR